MGVFLWVVHLLDEAGETEVSYFDGVPFEKYVLGFNISVNYIVQVKVVEGFTDLFQDLNGFYFAELS